MQTPGILPRNSNETGVNRWTLCVAPMMDWTDKTKNFI